MWGPLSAFNFQAREQPPFERVCWRLTGSAIDHSQVERGIRLPFQIRQPGPHVRREVVPGPFRQIDQAVVLVEAVVRPG